MRRTVIIVAGCVEGNCGKQIKVIESFDVCVSLRQIVKLQDFDKFAFKQSRLDEVTLALTKFSFSAFAS